MTIVCQYVGLWDQLVRSFVQLYNCTETNYDTLSHWGWTYGNTGSLQGVKPDEILVSSQVPDALSPWSCKWVCKEQIRQDPLESLSKETLTFWANVLHGWKHVMYCKLLHLISQVVWLRMQSSPERNNWMKAWDFIQF